MPLEVLQLGSLDELYQFVESAVARTGLILDWEATYRPWARAVSTDCPDVRWYYPAQPLAEPLLQHLGNFCHAPVSTKGFVLLEHGRVLKAVDADAAQGSSQPSRLVALVKDTFTPKRRASAGSEARRSRDFTGDPYVALGASENDSDEEIKKKYKQLLLQYHPDRVDHLGPELKELAARKTTEINAAYALIRRQRGF